MVRVWRKSRAGVQYPLKCAVSSQADRNKLVKSSLLVEMCREKALVHDTTDMNDKYHNLMKRDSSVIGRIQFSNDEKIPLQ
jgi:hypothetical protein